MVLAGILAEFNFADESFNQEWNAFKRVKYYVLQLRSKIEINVPA